MPHLIVANLSALAIASLYYYWRDVYQARKIKEKVLRERVAFMLWKASQQLAA